ncbi:MAG TPA: ShlB/FhaC/HecB family hemolysin secretion/activation protein [Caldimonas sp.]|jgi:hemolysin activation/secretion protein|nr:ShlB/FhaC/HecB family hemolysin secretion/activation protein [Caldimonas sp.]HEX2542403.1 ShlB/FhaC/HecB family hemolysin secretion/activation protein [Caldimonas sp.]
MTAALLPSRAALLIACWSGLAAAQTLPPPNAGSVLQQVQPSLVPAPAPGSAQTLPPLNVPRAVTAPAAGGGRVDVKGFRIAGLTTTQAEPLLPALQKYVGAGKTLADLEDAAKDVEVVLQRRGLFLAQVYVPEQTLSDGVVTLQVLEGRIGSVKVEVGPGVRVAAERLDRIVAILRGNPVAERELVERALFTLGDLRGIAVSTALTPGNTIGHADLVVKVSKGADFATTIDVDNGGSLFTGRFRVNAGFDWFNPSGRGDVASLRAQVTTNLGAKFVRASWLTPINAVGTKFGVAASYLKYELGSALFSSLAADGTAEAYSLQLLHPLIRSRNNNVFLQASTDYRRFEDRVQAIPLVTKKDIAPYVTLGVVGDFRDTFAGGGITNYTVNAVGGRLRFRTEDEAVVDAANYRSAGKYAKLQLGASRLQVLPNKHYLFVSAVAQLASKNLDSSEKFSLGGPYGVRAYPSPESPSDSGLITTWEYRAPLPITRVPGDWIFTVFGDYGVGRLHQDPLPTDVGNTRKLVGHGLGLTYGGSKGLLVKAWIAMRGGTRAQSDDSKVRLYALVSQPF